MRRFEEISEAFTLTLGDAIQNLRASLDHVVWTVVDLFGGHPGRHTGFPIYLSPDAYDKGSPRLLEGMPETTQEIVRAVQPFAVGAADPALDPLWLLQELARIDRHRLLHTVAAGVLVMGPLQLTGERRHVRSLGEVRHIPLTSERFTRERVELMRVPLTPDGPNPFLGIGGATNSVIVIDLQDVDGPPAGVFVGINVLDDMLARCKAVWEAALTAVEPLLRK